MSWANPYNRNKAEVSRIVSLLVRAGVDEFGYAMWLAYTFSDDELATFAADRLATSRRSRMAQSIES